jgi:DNA-binding NtrC family response regulator
VIGLQRAGPFAYGPFVMPATGASPNLLIVDDDEAIQNLLITAAKSRGWHPVAAGTGEQGCRLLDAEIKAVVLDHGLPGGDGIQVLARLRALRPDVPVVMLTGHNDAETAVRSIRAGADDYLTKPFELERLFSVIQEACRNRRQNVYSQRGESGAAAQATATLLRQSRSAQMRELFRQMEKAAQLQVTVLLTGESGTGKTLIAREIHGLSARAREPFIPVSCPALPRELLESELVGHERGAFTGASASRVGRFEQATKGTIFLDEIGDLPSELQPKLLTVLQDQEFFRVGGNQILRTGARIITATNIDLKTRVAEGRFREDLYYRLHVLEMRLPSLRERLDDLPDLVRLILERIARARCQEPWNITKGAMLMLAGHSWPGNIRQLENVLERATAFAEGVQLDEHDFTSLIHDGPGMPSVQVNLTLQEAERQIFVKAYERNGKNKARTARDLGIAERTVYNLLARYELR